MDILIIIILIAIVVIAVRAKEKSRYSPSSKKQEYRYISPEEKGKAGEKVVSDILGQNVYGQKCVFNDYMLAAEDKSCQIDHIVINTNGVFVIETKNYSGQIYGKDGDKEWLQVLAYGKVKNRFYNPVKQNATHIYRVNQLLGNSYPIHGYVVMTSGDFDGVHSSSVVNPAQLLRKLSANRNIKLSSQEIEHIHSILDGANVSKQVSNKEHVANIHKMQTDIHNNICPRCGGELVLRHGKYGDFYGCSNYPKCKFIKSDK